MQPKAYGTFKRRGPYIFRTDARLQWGTSKEPLGIIVMLNPGSSKLSDDNKWERFSLTNKDTDIENEELDMDETMQAVTEILVESHPSLKGVLEIRNIFNLRTERSKAPLAIDAYQKMLGQEMYEDVLHSNFDDLGTFLWVWFGWTVETSPVLRKRKLHILNRIPDHLKRFAICKKPPSDVPYPEYYSYHPFPQIRKRVESYKLAMVCQMQDYWRLSQVELLKGTVYD